MAYVSKEKKAKIVEAFKALNLPKPWKITFSVDHHSTMVATIQKAPASVRDDYIFRPEQQSDKIYVNEYHIDKSFKGETLSRLCDALVGPRGAFGPLQAHKAFWVHYFGDNYSAVQHEGSPAACRSCQRWLVDKLRDSRSSVG